MRVMEIGARVEVGAVQEEFTGGGGGGESGSRRGGGVAGTLDGQNDVQVVQRRDLTFTSNMKLVAAAAVTGGYRRSSFTAKGPITAVSRSKHGRRHGHGIFRLPVHSLTLCLCPLYSPLAPPPILIFREVDSEFD